MPKLPVVSLKHFFVFRDIRPEEEEPSTGPAAEEAPGSEGPVELGGPVNVRTHVTKIIEFIPKIISSVKTHHDVGVLPIRWRELRHANMDRGFLPFLTSNGELIHEDVS